MRRLFLSVVVLVLSLLGVVIAPLHSGAAPLPAPYSGSAGGDVVAFDLDVAGSGVADARLAVTQSTVDGGATPTATATATNLAAGATGVTIVTQSEVQTAPPDHPTADTSTFSPAVAPGLLSLATLTTSVQAHTEAVACEPGGAELADSHIESAAAGLTPTGLGIVAATGNSSTDGVVAIVPEPVFGPGNRAVESTATGTISGTSFLDGAVQVTITDSTLRAHASGEPGGAYVGYSSGEVTVSAGGTTYPIGLGDAGTFTAPGGRVVIRANEPVINETFDGQTATGSVTVATAVVTVGTGTTPLATATIDLLPLRASAVAPPGGIDCLPPAPVLNTPADGSTTADTTPRFTGTAVPKAEVEIFVDGGSIGTTTANALGNFSLTPTTPLATGDYTAVARQTTDGGTSPASNANDFTVLGAPVLDELADGTVTNDATPTFTGTALPGAQVDIVVDGALIGTTTANGSGEFSFTPGTALAAGDHEASARARANGATSGLSNVNDFTIDVASAAPVIRSPDDGGTTTDPTPPIRGTAEPGSKVIIIIDGEEVGSTVAGENGVFSFTVPDRLPLGEHEVAAIAVDEAGNRSEESSTVAFSVLAARADAGPSDSLADTGGPQAWLPLVAGLGVLVGTGILAATRWRRRDSQAGL